MAYGVAMPGAMPGQGQGQVQGQVQGQMAHAPMGQPVGQGQIGSGMYPTGTYVTGGPMQPGYPMNVYGALPPPPPPPQQSSAPSGLTNDRFLKGLLIGAAAAYILTNESVQRSAIKGAVKAWTLVQGGLEEVKERFQDADAELHAADMAKAAEKD
jgi:hypothetical protein